MSGARPDKPQAATGTVTVACKLPNGLYLDIGRKGDTAGFTRRFEVRGPAQQENTDMRPRGRMPDGTMMLHHKQPVVTPGGYALTSGIPEDFWLQWLEEHKEMEIVKKNFIFAMPRPADAAARAREQAELRTGLEPISQDKPAPGITRVTADDGLGGGPPTA
jgi:hypothetical protein